MLWLDEQATTYVDPNQILKIEMPEAVEKLETAADMCRTYKTVFLRYKTWFNQKYPVNAMKFDMVPVFGRFVRPPVTPPPHSTIPVRSDPLTAAVLGDA